MQTLSIACLILAAALTAGCEVAPSDDSSGSADSSSSSDSSGSDTACQDLLEKTTCEASDGTGRGCVWRDTWRATRSEDTCEVEVVGRCFDGIINDSAAGCGAAAGCGDGPFSEPFYMIEEGAVVLLDMCGGTVPSGYEPCATGEASASDPPECACACELAPE